MAEQKESDNKQNKEMSLNAGTDSNTGSSTAARGGQGGGATAGNSQAASQGSTSPGTLPSGQTGSGGTKAGSFGPSGSAISSSGSQGGTGTGAGTARGLVDQAKQTAGQAYEVVSEKAATKLDEQKSTLTDGLSTVAETIRQAGDNLNTSAMDNGLTGAAAKYTTTAAQKIEDAAQYFEQNDVKAMLRDVEGFARRNPAIFLGAAFAAGVVLARFLKAGPDSSSRQAAGASFKPGAGSRENLAESFTSLPGGEAGK